jgi:hypothetical protein
VKGPDAIGGSRRGDRPAADLDQKALAPLALLGLLLLRLEEAQAAALALGVQAGQGLAQGQGLVLAKALPLGNDGGPQPQHRGAVDADHAALTAEDAEDTKKMPKRILQWAAGPWPSASLSLLSSLQPLR